MTKKIVVLIPLISMMVFLSGCMSGKVKPGNAKTTTQSSYAQYQQNRPDPENQPIGHVSLDKTTESIAGIYATTIELTDKSIAQIENSEVVAKLEKVRKEQGQAAWQAEVNALTGIDKQQYNAYLKNQVNALDTVDVYLNDALLLSKGIALINPSEFVSNPLKIPSALRSVHLATNQINYSVQALKWMKKNHDLYQMALNSENR